MVVKNGLKRGENLEKIVHSDKKLAIQSLRVIRTSETTLACVLTILTCMRKSFNLQSATYLDDEWRPSLLSTQETGGARERKAD